MRQSWLGLACRIRSNRSLGKADIQICTTWLLSLLLASSPVSSSKRLRESYKTFCKFFVDSSVCLFRRLCFDCLSVRARYCSGVRTLSSWSCRCLCVGNHVSFQAKPFLCCPDASRTKTLSTMKASLEWHLSGCNTSFFHQLAPHRSYKKLGRAKAMGFLSFYLLAVIL
jgi:hypothetical protein